VDDPTALSAYAIGYFKAGWHPIELPARCKWPPPEGRTGYGGSDMTRVEVEDAGWTGNIGLRMPVDVLGLDVDVYKGGDRTLADLVAVCGPLPRTWISHSGRNDGSGIRLFRVPRLVWIFNLPGIEIIQRVHRYLAAPPSVHPDGRVYAWVNQAEAISVGDVPVVEDLPELPWSWIARLSRAQQADVEQGAQPHAADAAAVNAFIATHDRADAPGYISNILRHFLDHWRSGYSRHDTMQHALLWALENVRAGVAAAGPTLDALASLWVDAMGDDIRRAQLHSEHRTTEFEAMVRHAVGKVEAKTDDEIWTIRNDIVGPTMNPGPVLVAEALPRNLPDSFWERPELAAIRAWAHARMRSADAVYAAVRARLCVLVPHGLTIDTGIAVPISLNSLIAVVGSSGAGKTTSAALGRTLVPIIRTDVYEGPLGSGEGIVEIFYEYREEPNPTGKGTTKVKVKTKDAALLLLDEGEALTRMAARSGNTILPTLRSAYSGELLGQSNARQETRRVLPAGSYRFVLLVGLQDLSAAELLADSATGTPQRVVMFNANDPTIPAEVVEASPPWPLSGPWMPAAITGGQTMGLALDVLTEVRERALAIQRGTLVLDTLDAHRDQNRLKEAAMLAILSGRLQVSGEDWRLAGMVLDASDSVRRWIMGRSAAAQQKIEDERTGVAVRRQRIAGRALDADAHERAVVGGARAMARRAARSAGSVTRRDLIVATAGQHRQNAAVEEMLSRAEELDWLRPVGDEWIAGGSEPS
jgi:Bifunctional DNA primase/polymerase, N-terminal